jgi:hypothetical protein
MIRSGTQLQIYSTQVEWIVKIRNHKASLIHNDPFQAAPAKEAAPEGPLSPPGI